MENLNWHTASVEELELLQKTAVNNGVFANNYSAVNSIIYAKKYDSQIAVQDGWIFEKYYAGGDSTFAFPHRIDGKTDGVEGAVHFPF